MKDKPAILELGKDKFVVARAGAIYRVKELYKECEFSFEELVKILIQLPFEYSVVPLNYDSRKSSYPRDTDLDNHLVELHTTSRDVLEIYPSNFRRIASIRVIGGAQGNNPLVAKLNPENIMCDDGGPGFRCCYHPHRRSFGLKDKKKDLGSGQMTTFDDFGIEIFKFSNQDARRIYQYLSTLEDCSEEAEVRRNLERLLRDDRRF